MCDSFGTGPVSLRGLTLTLNWISFPTCYTLHEDLVFQSFQKWSLSDCAELQMHGHAPPWLRVINGLSWVLFFVFLVSWTTKSTGNNPTFHSSVLIPATGAKLGQMLNIFCFTLTFDSLPVCFFPMFVMKMRASCFTISKSIPSVGQFQFKSFWFLN